MVVPRPPADRKYRLQLIQVKIKKIIVLAVMSLGNSPSYCHSAL